jgi:hypothetical protein
MAVGKFNFRATSGFVSDAGDETYVISTDDVSQSNLSELYPTVRNGHTFGWDSQTGMGTRNRDATNGHLAGIHQTSGVIRTFRYDLPSAGSKRIRLALGDFEASQGPMQCDFFDDTTLLFSVTGSTSGADRYLDASGVERTGLAGWDANNVAVQATFTTTIFKMKIGDGSSFTTVAHVEVEDAGPVSMVWSGSLVGAARW